MSQQTGSSRSQITKAIIRNIRDCQCESVRRLSKGDVNPPVLRLREVENLHGVKRPNVTTGINELGRFFPQRGVLTMHFKPRTRRPIPSAAFSRGKAP